MASGRRAVRVRWFFFFLFFCWSVMCVRGLCRPYGFRGSGFFLFFAQRQCPPVGWGIWGMFSSGFEFEEMELPSLERCWLYGGTFPTRGCSYSLRRVVFLSFLIDAFRLRRLRLARFRTCGDPNAILVGFFLPAIFPVVAASSSGLGFSF